MVVNVQKLLKRSIIRVAPFFRGALIISLLPYSFIKLFKVNQKLKQLSMADFTY